MAAPGCCMESEVTTYMYIHTAPWSSHCSANQPTGEKPPPRPAPPPYLHISLSLSLLFLHPSLSLSPCSKHRSVGLINGRCQKRCQSILCLFGFIWTSGVVRGDGGGVKGGGERTTMRRGGSDREREGERKETDRGEGRRRIMGAAQLSSAQRPASPGGPAGPIGPSLALY